MPQGTADAAPPQPFELSAMQTPAILDTGATRTAISRRLAETLLLAPIGKTTVLTAAGPKEANTYQVDLLMRFGSAMLPIERLSITEFDAPDGDGAPQILLGMDVIQRGCLTIDFQGKWTFSL